MSLAFHVAQLRHAYSYLVRWDMEEFADGLIAPALRCLERLQGFDPEGVADFDSFERGLAQAKYAVARLRASAEAADRREGVDITHLSHEERLRLAQGVEARQETARLHREATTARFPKGMRPDNHPRMKAPKHALITITLDTERFRLLPYDDYKAAYLLHRLLSGEEVSEKAFEHYGMDVEVRER